MTENSSTPVLSIITPVYNGEKYIFSCIESVAAQQCPAIEHIVVDGASTDGTTAIVRERATVLPHLRLLSEPDRGQSDAQNKGIRLARADYVGILNVDDFYAPGALRRVAGILPTLRTPRFVYGNCNVLNEGDVLDYVNRPAFLKFENCLVDLATWPHPYNPSSYFYAKSIHDVVGYYDVDEHFALDLKFILAAIQKIDPLHIDEVLGNYRYIPGTKTFRSMEDGTLEIRKRKVLHDAFVQAPLRTKIRVLSLWVSHQPAVLCRSIRSKLW
jgi:glycosyltransferase involved in cell wall biosynthesis